MAPTVTEDNQIQRQVVLVHQLSSGRVSKRHRQMTSEIPGLGLPLGPGSLRLTCWPAPAIHP